MPMICAPHRDWLFYILYYGDVKLLSQLIRQCQGNILRRHHHDSALGSLLERYSPDPQKDPLLVLRAKFFVLLHEDEETRKELAEKAATSFGCFGAVPKPKASNFYHSLHHDVIPKWVSDEDVQLHDFIESLREAYLVA